MRFPPSPEQLKHKVIVKGKILSVMRDKAQSADAEMPAADESSTATSAAGAFSRGASCGAASAPGMLRSETTCSFAEDSGHPERLPTGRRPRAATIGTAQVDADADADDDDDDDDDDVVEQRSVDELEMRDQVRHPPPLALRPWPSTPRPPPLALHPWPSTPGPPPLALHPFALHP